MWSASNAYSTHVPGSRSRSRRSRTVSLPSECWRSTRSGPPISRARSRRAFKSPTSGPQSWTSPPPVVVTASSSHGEHLPLAGHALQSWTAAVGEVDAGAGDEIADGTGDENLARVCDRGDARPDVHGDPGEVITAQLALTGVETGPNLEPEIAGTGRDGLGTVDGATGSVESGQEAVARGLDLLPAEPVQLMTDRRVVRVQQLVPALVASGSGTRSRLHDVGEQHGLEHTVDLDRGLVAPTGEELLDGVEGYVLSTLGPVQVPGSWELEETRPRDLVRQVLTALGGDGVVISAVHHERRGVDRRERAAHGDIAVPTHDLAHHVGRGGAALVAGHERGRLRVRRHVGDEEPQRLSGAPPRHQPLDERLDDGRIDAEGIVRTPLHAGERAPQHERGHPLRIRRREQCRERPAFRDADERSPLAPRRIHDGSDVVHPVLSAPEAERPFR